ncbi:UDP-N-acetylmuramoyl-L-alanine--D-glutamate ligase [Gilvimarinus agarilyticus]|uniref:UDP-N-acetylmuramoyl-L-alanine--D-glutamate ligase n=1 Tax=Gilvimarinus sp. 2_MG-2023 TaxID=3062666 RepID=UPI001C08C80F|nr:UDP-N-acetylmuramoyl-L-alanine--D-glutamate ligase [Gilvimarinus sp. 2_MG-2023]MBU2885400.1 UDP-N-acetylmuramoyl-L-alanine--D-glutamate ligase [Gilvimarinus agarilyticus]MDO6570299.1 UDP-N-acetylmuramoyl-L-alanine--D-glutamate ligase [Gilvimarinus sp. 2_MG-2023]
MSELIATSRCVAVIGTGITGLSVARFLQESGQRFTFFDTRELPPNATLIAEQFPDVHCEFGSWDESLLLSMDEIIVSPGVSLKEPRLALAKAQGVAVLGDIDLFVQHAKAPIIAITGSNAKSTVTTLVGEMAQAQGVNVAVGGNLGTPALDLLNDAIELYVLELSSFQLETTSKLGAQVASILNISPDHMDRYDSIPAYHAAKQRVYFGAQQVVVNRRDILTHPPIAADVTVTSFGGSADFKNMGLQVREGEAWLCDQLTPLMPVGELSIVGSHNVDNALAALAIGKAAGFTQEAMVQALRSFRGLPHRCEPVGVIDDVKFINDSKGTNVGATLAAINGLANPSAKLVVLLGGVAKDADFSALKPVLMQQARHVIVYGQDASLLAEALQGVPGLVQVAGMAEAFDSARKFAQPKDSVLLSPACASFDEFDNYIQRGEIFSRWVGEAANG